MWLTLPMHWKPLAHAWCVLIAPLLSEFAISWNMNGEIQPLKLNNVKGNLETLIICRIHKLEYLLYLLATTLKSGTLLKVRIFFQETILSEEPMCYVLCKSIITKRNIFCAHFSLPSFGVNTKSWNRSNKISWYMCLFCYFLTMCFDASQSLFS